MLLIGEKLKNLRTERNISLNSLAKQLEFKYSQLWNAENNKEGASVNMIIAYAKYFNVSADYLLGLKETEN